MGHELCVTDPRVTSRQSCCPVDREFSEVDALRTRNRSYRMASCAPPAREPRAVTDRTRGTKASMAVPEITRAHRALIGAVAAGAFIIAGIGFTGSYAAVRTLALHKGFGDFSYVFPIGVDVGIAVLLALDLVLTWLRIPFPLLRQTAWLLTGGTIVFNAASSWGDPLAMAMHAIIPVLFVVVVEAARHAVGRMADITADRHMESVRLMRWLLSPVPTFRLWRRMKLWELRSYDEVVRLEQNRLVYRTHLRARYGRNWRRQAPVETLLPLKLAKYGVPLDLEAVKTVTAATAVTAVTVAPNAPAQLQAQPQLQAQQPVPQPVPQSAAHQVRPQDRPQGTVAGAFPTPGQVPAPAGASGSAPHLASVPDLAQQSPQPAPVLPLTGPHPDPVPVAVDILSRLAKHRLRRPLHDPDGDGLLGQGEDPYGYQDNPTRGVAWLPKQQQPGGGRQQEAGPEGWFAAKTVPDGVEDADDVEGADSAEGPDSAELPMPGGSSQPVSSTRSPGSPSPRSTSTSPACAASSTPTTTSPTSRSWPSTCSPTTE